MRKPCRGECGGNASKFGLCQPCAKKRWLDGRLTHDLYGNPIATCTVDRCKWFAQGRGLCPTHRRQARYRVEVRIGKKCPICKGRAKYDDRPCRACIRGEYGRKLREAQQQAEEAADREYDWVKVHRVLRPVGITNDEREALIASLSKAEKHVVALAARAAGIGYDDFNKRFHGNLTSWLGYKHYASDLSPTEVHLAVA